MQAKRDEEPALYSIRGNPVIVLYLGPDSRALASPSGDQGIRRYDDFEAVFSYYDTVSKAGIQKEKESGEQTTGCIYPGK